MLKSISMKNFKSFKLFSQIDLERTNYQMLSSTNIINNLLKGVMFVGANASGKSNSLMSVRFLLDCLFGKQLQNIASFFCLFSKDPSMELNYSFTVDGKEIEYIIGFDKVNSIITETLSVEKQEIVFRKGKYAKVVLEETTQHEDVPNNTLFLRDVYFNTKFRGNPTLQKWFDFLSNSIYVDLYHNVLVTYKDLDLSLTGYLDNNGTDEINSFFNEYNFEQNVEYNTDAMGPTIKIHSDEKMIFFKRKGIDDPIPLVFESTGNTNLIRLLPAFFYCIKNSSMLLLDEFSSGFHNDLEELLIKYFFRNAKESQLLFVSHSTNLLTNRLLRPDQIYSVDFDVSGSHLNRFSNEGPREAQNLEKMYLSGIFRGVPRYEH